MKKALKNFRICCRWTIDGAPLQRRRHRVPIKYPLQWFFPKMGIISTGTYAGIGKQFVSSLKML